MEIKYPKRSILANDLHKWCRAVCKGEDLAGGRPGEVDGSLGESRRREE